MNGIDTSNGAGGDVRSHLGNIDIVHQQRLRTLERQLRSDNEREMTHMNDKYSSKMNGLIDQNQAMVIENHKLEDKLRAEKENMQMLKETHEMETKKFEALLRNKSREHLTEIDNLTKNLSEAERQRSEEKKKMLDWIVRLEKALNDKEQEVKTLRKRRTEESESYAERLRIQNKEIEEAVRQKDEEIQLMHKQHRGETVKFAQALKNVEEKYETEVMRLNKKLRETYLGKRDDASKALKEREHAMKVMKQEHLKEIDSIQRSDEQRDSEWAKIREAFEQQLQKKQSQIDSLVQEKGQQKAFLDESIRELEELRKQRQMYQNIDIDLRHIQDQQRNKQRKLEDDLRNHIRRNTSLQEAVANERMNVSKLTQENEVLKETLRAHEMELRQRNGDYKDLSQRHAQLVHQKTDAEKKKDQYARKVQLLMRDLVEIEDPDVPLTPAAPRTPATPGHLPVYTR